jgi:hypothetical protein
MLDASHGTSLDHISKRLLLGRLMIILQYRGTYIIRILAHIYKHPDP